MRGTGCVGLVRPEDPLLAYEVQTVLPAMAANQCGRSGRCGVNRVMIVARTACTLLLTTS